MTSPDNTMTLTTRQPGLASHLINIILSIKPLNNFARNQARKMMIKRAANIGVDWHKEVQKLQAKNLDLAIQEVENHHVKYPPYYLSKFHAYDSGNLSWEAATEEEVAATAVHSGIWPEAGAQGDAKLRESYHQLLKQQLLITPQEIIDLGCGAGMSSFAMQQVYPQAKITGLDLSPYFLAIAKIKSTEKNADIKWIHTLAENTGLPDNSCDLVSSFLLFHELPQFATLEILQEVRRLLRPGGYFAFMDMNPQSEIYAKMPPYILTLLKSTEPYLDQYFVLDFEEALMEAGFAKPVITPNSPRHRTVIAKAI